MGVPTLIPNSALRGKATLGRSSKFSRRDHAHSVLGISQILFTLPAADFNVLTDQLFTKAWTFGEYVIEEVRARDASGTVAAAVGGIYTGAGKTGTQLVAAAFAYTNLNAVGLGISVTLAAAGLAKQTATPIFALSTAQGAARTVALEIIGVPLTEL